MFGPHPDDARRLRDAFARAARGEQMPQSEAYELLDALLGETFPRPTREHSPGFCVQRATDAHRMTR